MNCFLFSFLFFLSKACSWLRKGQEKKNHRNRSPHICLLVAIRDDRSGYGWPQELTLDPLLGFLPCTTAVVMPAGALLMPSRAAPCPQQGRGQAAPVLCEGLPTSRSHTGELEQPCAELAPLVLLGSELPWVVRENQYMSIQVFL